MLRLFCAVLLLSWGSCFGDDLASKNTWAITKTPPSGMYAIGWGTVLLSNGLMLGVGNANVGRHSQAFLYDDKTTAWSPAGDIPDGIVGLASSVTRLPSGAILTLGSDANQNSVALLFDPLGRQWNPTGRLPSKSIGYSAKTVMLSTGDVLLLSNAVLSNPVHTLGWLYNFKKNIWSVTQGLPRETQGFLYAAEMANGQVLAIAEDTSTRHWVGMLYDPSKNSWSLTGNIPTAMQGSTINTTILSDGTVLVSGFQSSPSAFVALLFNPKSNTWAEAGTLPKETIEIKAAKLLPDGSVLAISSNMMSSSLTGLLFNPVNNKWEKTGDMPTGLIGIKLNETLPDGTLWVIGRKSNIRSDELIYSPTQKTWTTIGNLPNGIIHVSSPIRENGAVLLFTGPNDGSRSGIDNVMLYVP